MAKTPVAFAAALVQVGSYRPPLCAATRENYREMCALSKKHGCPMVIRADTLDDLAALAKDCASEGAQKLVMDLSPKTLGDFLVRSTAVREGHHPEKVPESGYPVFFDTTTTGMQDAAIALGIVKYASVLITTPLSAESSKAVLTLRQNIYTDPQKPIQMNPGWYGSVRRARTPLS